MKESIRSLMKPKSREEIETTLIQLKEGGEVRIFDEIIGKTLKEIKGEKNDNYISFLFEDGDRYTMCDSEAGTGNDVSVTIEDIVGDLDDLIGSPLTIAEEITNRSATGNGSWTFYKFATIKGYVDIRWYGTSNGYYSENASFYKEGH